MKVAGSSKTGICCVVNCGNRNRPLYRTPNPKRQLERFQQWVKAICNPRHKELSESQIYARAVICCKHFRAEDFYIGNPLKLISTAVPTLNLNTYVEDTSLQVEPSTSESQVITECVIEVVDDPSDHQLVPESELLLNFNLYDPKFLNVSDGLTARVTQPLFPQNSPLTALDRNISSPVQCKDVSLENCNDEEQNESSEVTPNRNWENLENRPVTGHQPEACNGSVTGIESFIDQPVPTQLEKPYFKAVKSFLPDTNRITEVCRICFQSLEDDEVIKLYEEYSEQEAVLIKNMLKLVLPELDLEMYPNTVICVKCAELLVYSYQLKEKWLSTEEKLQKLIEKKKGEMNRDENLLIVGKRIEKKPASEMDHDYVEIPRENLQDWNDVLMESRAAESEEQCLSKKLPGLRDILSSKNQVSAEQLNRCTRDSENSNKMLDSRPYMCEHCGRTYLQRKRLNQHMKVHKNPQNLLQDPTIMCEICGQLYKSTSSLNVHKQTHVELRCSFCGRAFEGKRQLHRHITLKHVPTSYQCHLCGKQYSSEYHLDRHLKLHNPANKTKACHLCDKKFFFAYNLKQHLRSHVKQSFLKCDYCEKSMKRYCLETHMKIHHKNEFRYVCGFCNKTYWRKSGIDNHIRRHHPPHIAEQESNEENCAVDSIQQILTLEL